MKKFERLNTTAVPVNVEHVDTDQIIPARFLKATSREGFGENMFRDWRFNPDGTVKTDNIFNNPKFKGDVLLAGTNFGCGSSREHAAWAIADYGFKVIISSEFADIFKNNALNNEILTIEIAEENVQEIMQKVEANPAVNFDVNLENNELTVGGKTYTYTVPQFKKECLIKGVDSIDYLLEMKEEIKTFEANRASKLSWI